MIGLDQYTLIKAHLILSVIFTQIASLFIDEKQPPYFPIEVSRTAANGYYSALMFRTGIQTLIITMLLGGTLKWKYLFIYLSLLGIAHFDDVNHWHLHVLGVVMLFVGFVNLLVSSGSQSKDITIICMAAVIYLVRLALKTGVVYAFELSTNEWLYPGVLQRSLAIMYQGQAACHHPYLTILVFKLCAMGQWVVFWLLSEMIHE